MDQLKVLKNRDCYKRDTRTEQQNYSFYGPVLCNWLSFGISRDCRQSGLLVDKVLTELSLRWISAGYCFTFHCSGHYFFKKIGLGLLSVSPPSSVTGVVLGIRKSGY